MFHSEWISMKTFCLQEFPLWQTLWSFFRTMTVVAMTFLICLFSLYKHINFNHCATNTMTNEINNQCEFWKSVKLLLFFLHFLRIGFEFSEYEPSALVQHQGGPCAVIAPVQAFLIKTLVSETNTDHSLSDVSTCYTKRKS